MAVLTCMLRLTSTPGTLALARALSCSLSSRARRVQVSTVTPCLEGMAVFRNPGDDTLYGLMSHLTVRGAAMFWVNASSDFQL